MRLKVSNVCQLLDKSKYPATTTNKGITITNNGDGLITLNGTTTEAGDIYHVSEVNLINGHKYFVYDNQGGSFNNVVFTVNNLGSADNSEGNIWTYLNSNSIQPAYFWVDSGRVINNRVYKPQLFDLTEMYGIGNEPTTVAQFRQDFPNEMYEYSPECWKKFRRLKYVTETKNLFDKNNATIINGYIYYNQLTITESPIDKTIVFPCKPNTTYTFSKMYTNRLFMAETSEKTPAVGTTCTNAIANLGEPPSQNYCTLTTTATANNLIITICALYNTETYTLQEILDSVQIEEGSTPTLYQPYGYLPLNRGKYIENKEPVNVISFY